MLLTSQNMAQPALQDPCPYLYTANAEHYGVPVSSRTPITTPTPKDPEPQVYKIPGHHQVLKYAKQKTPPTCSLLPSTMQHQYSFT
jgi:hypothetical protein